MTSLYMLMDPNNQVRPSVIAKILHEVGTILQQANSKSFHMSNGALFL